MVIRKHDLDAKTITNQMDWIGIAIQYQNRFCIAFPNILQTNFLSMMFVIEIDDGVSAFIVIEIDRVDEGPNQGFPVLQPFNVGGLEAEQGILDLVFAQGRVVEFL